MAHRLCLDHPERVLRAAVLDIVPTATLFAATDRALAMGYYHWFFLIQPEPLPERLIGAEPLFYLHAKLGQWSAAKDTSWLDPAALAEYERCFHAGDDPGLLRGLSGRRHHRPRRRRRRLRAADRLSAAGPVGRAGLMHRSFDVLATWREKAAGPVEGRALPCGHYLPEECPDEVVAEFVRFFE